MASHPGQAAGDSFDPATSGIMPDEWVTHLHLLRHGEVERFGERVVRGQKDVPLSGEGREQSALLAAWFRASEPRPDRLFASDLSRCEFLAELLSEGTGVPLESTPLLREQSMGRWEGHDWRAITESDEPRVTAYWDDYVHTRPPDGESLQELSDRTQSWWGATLAEARGKRIVAVTHVGFIRALLCQLLGVPLSEALRFAPAVASHTSLLVSEAGAVLATFGERPWLSARRGKE